MCAFLFPPPQIRAPGDYRLRYHNPVNCDPNNCTYFMGIDTNEGNPFYLDVYLTAEIDGWVAVGFSESPDMVCSDSLIFTWPGLVVKPVCVD